MSSERKQLPIGIQTFAKIRQGDYYYVDKTQLALTLVKEGSHYFLSRPRRFGKSLFLDTLKELFEGKQALFTGLAAQDQWDWSIKYPVLRFSFGNEKFQDTEGLPNILNTQLTHLEQQFGTQRQFDHISGRFADLIIQVHRLSGQPVVILIDEYDKPILDALQVPDVARANRDFLRGFYATIKEYDAHIKFSFLTGVSKFSKVSLFSGLNNLSDITLDPRYSTICGYTDADVDTVFALELEGLDRDEIRSWYNGYNWRGAGVYNPFDILLLFDKREFSNYWFETGTPTFLVDLLFERQLPTPQLEQMISSEAMLSSFDVDQIDTEALLFQTGYLTIHKHENLGGQHFYTLGYPNREVYQSLNEYLLSALVKDKSKKIVNNTQLYRLLLVNDFPALKTLFHRFFASIPHHWYTNNSIQSFEGY